MEKLGVSIGTEITFETNGAIYARLLNELYEVVCEATGNVTNIDKDLPNVATISFNKTAVTAGENVTATVTQSDVGLSGIDITNCKYAFTVGNTALGITDADLSKYTGSFTKETNDTLTLNCPKAGKYYLHVLSVDKAGNKRETISNTCVNSSKTYILAENGKFTNGFPTGCGYAPECTQIPSQGQVQLLIRRGYNRLG